MGCFVEEEIKVYIYRGQRYLWGYWGDESGQEFWIWNILQDWLGAAYTLSKIVQWYLYKYYSVLVLPLQS